MLMFLAAATFITRALFIYRHGTPEPDATAMVAGMALAMSGDVSLGDALLYGRHVNPGMHFLAAHVFPALHVPPQQLMMVLNWVTVLCASLLVFPLYSMMRRHLEPTVAVAAMAVWVLSPVAWESGTYYHPLVPATLLLVLSIGCAARVRRTGSGVAWRMLATLLAAGAFMLRVEIAIVWPAFLVWTLTSKARARNAALLFLISGGAVAAYLLLGRTIAGATSSTAPDVAGFLRRIVDMYFHSVNINALPRSATWMTLALGIGTLGACVAGLARFGARGEDRRIVATALAWALPSILFWLPQPVPIVRHYLLASIGLAVLLGVCVLKRASGRRLVLLTASIALANLVVPEVAYRLYNSGSPAPKTPHGSFFYYHQLAVSRIDRDNATARNILSCGTGNLDAKSCALVQWEQLAHVAYVAAVSGKDVTPEPMVEIFPGVRYVRFDIGEGETRLIHYVYFEDDSLRTIAANIMRYSHDAGYCLFAPQGLCDRVPQLNEMRESVSCY